MSGEEIEKLRWRQATADRRQEWRENAHVLNLHENAPDSDAGREFLASLESGNSTASQAGSTMMVVSTKTGLWPVRCIPNATLAQDGCCFLGPGHR